MKYGITNAKGGEKSNTLLTATTDATENSGVYTLALSYLDTTPKVNDFIVFVDSGALTTLYQVNAVDSTNATLTKIGDIGGGGGKQLYQHNVKVTKTGTINFYGVLIICNDSATKFNLSSLKQYLLSKGYNDYNHRQCNGGFATNGSNLYVAESICIYNYYGENVIRYYYANNSGTVQGGNDIDNSMVVDDNVEPL